MNRPEEGEYNPYYGTYINKVQHDIFSALVQVAGEVESYLQTLPPENFIVICEQLGTHEVCELP